jgi:hypothetical protein
MTDFREILESQKLAPLTVKKRLTAVKSFYKNYNILIPVLPRSTTKAKAELKRKQLPTKEELQEALMVCNPLEKALLLVGVSSGLSAIDICNLKISDFEKGLDKKTNITTLKGTRIKTDYDFL